ncbi:MAG: hypothetical protein HQK54_09755 [Oligoflexales bacterium]|nr:hypothetical protein [Oligoflexales bacterium]
MLSRILSATGVECLCPESLDQLHELARTKHFALYFLDIVGHRHLTENKIDFSNVPAMILLSEDRLEELHSYLAGIRDFTNFVAKNRDGKLSGADILVTAAKILSEDIFGIKKYLSWGAASSVFHIRDSNDKADHIEAVSDYCRNLGLRDSLITSVGLLTDELLMNAIYNAPRDSNGIPMYANESRTNRVVLKPREAARLEIGSDGTRLAISVSDPFGAVERKVILEYFARCFREDRQIPDLALNGGAGIGLYLCLNSVNNFIINVAPFERSEFIGIINIDFTTTRDHRRHPSFHYFSTDNKVSFLAIDPF